MRTTVATLVLCLGKLGGKVGESVKKHLANNHTKVIAIDTDINLLNRLSIETKQIASDRREGLGCAEDEKLGEKSCCDSQNVIMEITAPYEKIIIVGGLGKGFSTGAAIFLSDFFRKSKQIVVFVLTTPFSIEGQLTINKANDALTKIRKNSRTVICLSNDLLFSQLPADSSTHEAFTLATNYIYSGIKSLIDLLDENINDTISIEFSTISELLMHHKSECSIVNAKSETNNFAELAQAILDNPLSGGSEFVHAADRVLIKIIGGGLNVDGLKEGIRVMSETFKCINKSRYGFQFQTEDRALEASCLFISYPDQKKEKWDMQPEFNLIEHNKGIFSGRSSILLDDNSYSLDIPTYQRLNISLNDLD